MGELTKSAKRIAKVEQALRWEKQLDFFTAIVGDVAIKEQTDLMERPFFSLNKSLRFEPIQYDKGESYIRIVSGSETAIATIWDADILMWATSQIVEARNRGAETSSKFIVAPYDILRALGRNVSGQGYEELKASLNRLLGTVVTTNIRTEGGAHRTKFNWISRWVEKKSTQGEITSIEFELPDWFYRGALNNSEVLTIPSDYFELKGGLERWLYKICRKHGGKQPNGWEMSFKALYEKSGSLMRFTDFAIRLRKLGKKMFLVDYVLTIREKEGEEYLHFIHQEQALKKQLGTTKNYQQYKLLND